MQIRAVLALLLLVACGDSAAPPPPAPLAPPPPHPSGASENEVQTMRWVAETYPDVMTSVVEACNTATNCWSHSATNLPITAPSDAAACIERLVPACESGIQRLRTLAEAAASAAPEVRAAYRGIADQAEAELCSTLAVRALLATQPDAPQRLRRDSGNDTGLESFEEWAGRTSARNPAAATLNRSLGTCFTRWSEALPRAYPALEGWLRAHFYCGRHGCCTPERVGEMLAERVEPGPPDPRCH